MRGAGERGGGGSYYNTVVGLVNRKKFSNKIYYTRILGVIYLPENRWNTH